VYWRPMDQNTKDILNTVNFIKDRMLSKDDARTIIGEQVPGMICEELKPIHHELEEKSIDVSTRSTKNIRVSRGSPATTCGRSRSTSGSTEDFSVTRAQASPVRWLTRQSLLLPSQPKQARKGIAAARHSLSTSALDRRSRRQNDQDDDDERWCSYWMRGIASIVGIRPCRGVVTGALRKLPAMAEAAQICAPPS
jgi:hypothetical protein